MTTPRARGVLFEEDAARAVVRALTTQGWVADLSRERFQGEDDDEDHPWAVETDAPELVLELLIEEHDGWLDSPEPPAASPIAPPPTLPHEPRRIKGHWNHER